MSRAALHLQRPPRKPAAVRHHHHRTLRGIRRPAILANKQGLDGKTLDQARAEVTTPGTLAHKAVEDHINGRPETVLAGPDEVAEKAAQRLCCLPAEAIIGRVASRIFRWPSTRSGWLATSSSCSTGNAPTRSADYLSQPPPMGCCGTRIIPTTRVGGFHLCRFAKEQGFRGKSRRTRGARTAAASRGRGRTVGIDRGMDAILCARISTPSSDRSTFCRCGGILAGKMIETSAGMSEPDFGRWSNAPSRAGRARQVQGPGTQHHVAVSRVVPGHDHARAQRKGAQFRRPQGLLARSLCQMGRHRGAERNVGEPAGWAARKMRGGRSAAPSFPGRDRQRAHRRGNGRSGHPRCRGPHFGKAEAGKRHASECRRGAQTSPAARVAATVPTAPPAANLPEAFAARQDGDPESPLPSLPRLNEDFGLCMQP